MISPFVKNGSCTILTTKIISNTCYGPPLTFLSDIKFLQIRELRPSKRMKLKETSSRVNEDRLGIRDAVPFPSCVFQLVSTIR